MSYFGGYDQPPRKKKLKKGYVVIKGKAYPVGSSKPKKHSRPRDEGYGGYGSMFGGGGRKQSSLGQEYYGAGKNMYQMGKNIYTSPVASFIKKKVGKAYMDYRGNKREKQATKLRDLFDEPEKTEDQKAAETRRFMGY